MNHFRRGLTAGIPVGLGYLSVGFTFGMMAAAYGLSWWEATLISMATVTSAGQFAGLGMMVTPGPQSLAILISQLTINIRYSFMSVSLSQKLEKRFAGIYRWLLGFFITDEIFAVAIAQEEITRSYFLGLAVLPYLGWSGGTLLGAVIGSVLPHRLMSALSLAIYGMFIAVVAPDAARNVRVGLVVGLAALIRCAFYYLPGLNQISSGLAISAAAILAALVGAVCFPVEQSKEVQA